MERQPIVLSVVAAGTPEFPRFRVADQFLRYWTGSDWTEPQDEERGLLFSDSNTACHEVQRLLMLEYMDRPCRVFEAPVTLKLWTNQKVTRRQLIDWLAKVSKLVMDCPKLGNGPVDGSLGLCLIDWNKITEVGSGGADHPATDEEDEDA